MFRNKKFSNCRFAKLKASTQKIKTIRRDNMQRRHDHLHLRVDAAAMNGNRKTKTYIKYLIHIEERKHIFTMVRPNFNPRPSSLVSKLKIHIKSNYGFMNISMNDNLKWRIIKDPEEIEEFTIFWNKQQFR